MRAFTVIPLVGAFITGCTTHTIRIQDEDGRPISSAQAHIANSMMETGYFINANLYGEIKFSTELWNTPFVCVSARGYNSYGFKSSETPEQPIQLTKSKPGENSVTLKSLPFAP